MSYRPSPTTENAHTVRHDVHNTILDHYDDDEAMYPTASPPPDESVVRRAGYVALFLSHFLTRPPISQSVAAHELCCRNIA